MEEEIKGCIVTVAMLIVIANWQLFLILLLIIGVGIMASCIFSEQEKAAEQRKIEQEQNRQRRKTQEDNLARTMKQSMERGHIDYDEVHRFIRQTDPDFLAYVTEVAKIYRARLQEAAYEEVEQGELTKAMDAFDLLLYLYPKDTVYLTARTRTKAVLDQYLSPCCYIVDCGRGSINQSVVDAISQMSEHACKTQMKKCGLFFSLWYFAMKAPFQEHSYRGVLSAIGSFESWKYSPYSCRCLAIATLYCAPTRRGSGHKHSPLFPCRHSALPLLCIEAAKDRFGRCPSVHRR